MKKYTFPSTGYFSQSILSIQGVRMSFQLIVLASVGICANYFFSVSCLPWLFMFKTGRPYRYYNVVASFKSCYFEFQSLAILHIQKVAMLTVYRCQILKQEMLFCIMIFTCDDHGDHNVTCDFKQAKSNFMVTRDDIRQSPFITYGEDRKGVCIEVQGSLQEDF